VCGEGEVGAWTVESEPQKPVPTPPSAIAPTADTPPCLASSEQRISAGS
jgi:hypothetical protein